LLGEAARARSSRPVRRRSYFSEPECVRAWMGGWERPPEAPPRAPVEQQLHLFPPEEVESSNERGGRLVAEAGLPTSDEAFDSYLHGRVAVEVAMAGREARGRDCYASSSDGPLAATLVEVPELQRLLKLKPELAYAVRLGVVRAMNPGDSFGDALGIPARALQRLTSPEFDELLRSDQVWGVAIAYCVVVAVLRDASLRALGPGSERRMRGWMGSNWDPSIFGPYGRPNTAAGDKAELIAALIWFTVTVPATRRLRSQSRQHEELAGLLDAADLAGALGLLGVLLLVLLGAGPPCTADAGMVLDRAPPALELLDEVIARHGPPRAPAGGHEMARRVPLSWEGLMPAA